jgi:nicotinamidase/pyrazinamidase
VDIPSLRPQTGDALIVIDVQRDFLPGGALAVPEGNAVIAPLNRCISAFGSRQLPIFATRDWHPPNHCSFRAQGGPWPPHCVAGSPGAQFGAELALPATGRVISKAMGSDADAYSGFEGTDLAQQLRSLGCKRIFLGGLATDYCVRATALDARAAAFEVLVLEDAVRAVEVKPGDGMRALSELVSRGVRLASVAGIDS